MFIISWLTLTRDPNPTSKTTCKRAVQHATAKSFCVTASHVSLRCATSFQQWRKLIYIYIYIYIISIFNMSHQSQCKSLHTIQCNTQVHKYIILIHYFRCLESLESGVCSPESTVSLQCAPVWQWYVSGLAVNVTMWSTVNSQQSQQWQSQCSVLVSVWYV